MSHRAETAYFRRVAGELLYPSFRKGEDVGLGRKISEQVISLMLYLTQTGKEQDLQRIVDSPAVHEESKRWAMQGLRIIESKKRQAIAAAGQPMAEEISK